MAIAILKCKVLLTLSTLAMVWAAKKVGLQRCHLRNQTTVQGGLEDGSVEWGGKAEGEDV